MRRQLCAFISILISATACFAQTVAGAVDSQMSVAGTHKNEEAPKFDDMFFQIYYGGSQFDSEDFGGKLTFDGATKFSGRSSNLNFGFNVGKWLSRAIGLQLGYFEQMGGHNSMADPVNPDETYIMYMTHRGGRGEILVNPIAVMTDNNSIGRFSFSFSSGFEVGQMHLHRYGYNTYFLYQANNPEVTFSNDSELTGSLTVALQLRLYLSSHLALFGEARTSIMKYNTGYLENSGFSQTNMSVRESKRSFGIGLEYFLSNWDRFPNANNRMIRTAPRKLKQNVFLQYGGGFGHQVHWGEQWDRLKENETSYGLGYHFNEYISARLQYKTRQQRNNTEATGVIPHYTSMQEYNAMAMLNMSTHFRGIDNNGLRKSDVYFMVGPEVDVVKSETSQTAGAFKTGLHMTFRILSAVELYIEPSYSIYTKTLTNRWSIDGGATIRIGR